MPEQSSSTNITHPAPIDAAQIHAGLADRFGRVYPLWFESPISEAEALATRRAKLVRAFRPTNARGIVLAYLRGDGEPAQRRSATAFAEEQGCAIQFVPDRTTGARQYRREIGSLLAYCIDAMHVIKSSESPGQVLAYVAGLDRLGENAGSVRKIVGQLNDIGVPLYIGNLGVILDRVSGEKLIARDYIEALIEKSRVFGIRDALPRAFFDLAVVA